MKFCLTGMREELVPLKNHKSAVKLLDKARRKLSRFDPHSRSREELHAFIDQFQSNLIALSGTIDSTWFLQDKA